MITKLTLKNFRKHRDLSLTFEEGLNVLRGANEAGKSTTTEGILYALFGSKALRTPLSETVTWGEKESSLKVTLDIVIEGKSYTFTRSKGGAECNYDGGKVTGQGEVTDFASNLLGADAKTAAMLMLSSQSGLRGALDDGPAAVSALMGKLADFDLIDRVVASAQSNLLLGSDAPFRERLEQAGAELTALPVADPEIWMAHEERRRVAQVTLNTAQDLMAKVTEPAWRRTLDDLNAATAANTARQALIDRRATAVKGMEATQNKLSDALLRATRVPADQMGAARAAVEAFRNRQALAEVRDAIVHLGPYPEVFWEGGREEFEAEVADLRSGIRSHNESIQGSKGQITALRRQIIKGGKCPTCGHDAGNDDHVKEHNARIEAEVDLYQTHIDQHTENERHKSTMLKGMEDLERRARPWVAAAAKYAGNPNVGVDFGFHPPRVTWTGGEIDLSGKAAETKLRELEVADRSAMKAEGEVEAHRAALVEASRSIEQLDALIVKTAEIDMAPLQKANQDAYEDFRRVQEHIAAMQQVVGDAQLERDRAKDLHDSILNRKEVLLLKVAELEADIKAVSFNNNLMKKLRTIKPMITDHLWNTVLSAVSNFFSKLRGEASVVSKDASGFRVNGQTVESLSGSTLDVLALAIRVALTKTFIPHASFIILDEPFAACDTSRTGEGLGFLASMGFTQAVLASHDELSEAVAEKVLAI